MSTEFLLYEGFEELDAFGPFEVLAVGGFAPMLVTLSPADRVTGAHGAVVMAHAALSERPDLLVLPGGGWAARREHGAWGEAQRGTLPRAIRACHDAGTTVAGVCTGGMLLAKAGLLTGRPAVTHRCALEDLAAAGAEVIADARVVDDDDVITCGGVTAGIDLALRLLERRHGGAAAERAAEQIEYRPHGPVHMGPAACGTERDGG
ncbi:MAG: DJ-1/PfpI family protein [Solirubrobacteraceae bacterium]